MKVIDDEVPKLRPPVTVFTYKVRLDTNVRLVQEKHLLVVL